MESIPITSDTAYTQKTYNFGDIDFKDEEGNIYVVGRTTYLTGNTESGKKELLSS